MLATIFLPPSTERVTVRDIPRLIADAIHPPLPDDTPRVVSYLQKEATTPEQATEWCGSGNNFPVGLTDEDWQALNSGVWAGLPPLVPEAENDEGPRKLKAPLSEPQWEQYRVAYEANPPRSWRLYVVWRNTVFEQWLMNHEAQKQWKRLLEQQAAHGELVPRSPTSLIPTPGVFGRQLHESFLTVDEFAKFAAQFSVDVRVIRAFTRPVIVAPLLKTLRSEPPEEHIRLRENIGGISGEGACTVAVCLAALEEVAKRQAEGFLTVGEAAQLFSDSNAGLDVRDLIERMRTAKVGNPERRLVRGANRLPALEHDTFRAYIDLVKVEDVDEWLASALDVRYRLAPLCHAGRDTKANGGAIEDAFRDLTGTLHLRRDEVLFALHDIPEMTAHALVPGATIAAPRIHDEEGADSEAAELRLLLVLVLDHHKERLARALASKELVATWGRLPSSPALQQVLSLSELRKFCTSVRVEVAVLDESEREPEEQEAKAAHASVTHTLATRRDVLDPVIDLAEKTATNADDRAAVWNALTALAVAKDKPHPLLGFADGSVQYLAGDDAKFLTRDAFNKRWDRRKEKAAANRR